jgi:thioredoxin reductase
MNGHETSHFFVKTTSVAMLSSTMPRGKMEPIPDTVHDVIIIGGSYSGLSAALTLGRARRSVLLIDAIEPCNARVPHSHNLLTHDGEPPAALRTKARNDVARYDTVHLLNGRALEVSGSDGAFVVRTADGVEHHSRKLLLALGVRDELPPITGLSECWGISAAACPFCHGYEVSDGSLAIVGSTPDTVQYAMLLRNWSRNLNVFTNGPAEFTEEQRGMLHKQGIEVLGTSIVEVIHDQGRVRSVLLADGSRIAVDALFLRSRTIIPSSIPQSLGIVLNEQGLLHVDLLQRTNVAGVFACGDCTTPMRALSVAMASGTMAGSAMTHELVVTNH